MDAFEQPPELEGMAGPSARREHARRKANCEQRTRDMHPRIGGLLLAPEDNPVHEQAWPRGADGEERVAALLAKHLAPTVIVLHGPRDRAQPGEHRPHRDRERGRPVIDSKRYKGKVAVSKRVFGQAKLTIAGRDRTKLVAGLAKQVALVKDTLTAGLPDAPVRGALCFIDAELPMFGSLSLHGYRLLYAKALAKRINRSGPIPSGEISVVAAAVAAGFPAA